MEEIFTDASHWTISVGCKGSRTGIRGQGGRCTLGEYCDYIWADRIHDDGSKYGDVKPDASKTIWPGVASDLAQVSIGQIAMSIMAVQQQTSSGTQVLPAPGYCGGTDPSRVLSAETDWYVMNSKLGDSTRNALAEYSSLASTLTSTEFSFFNRWRTMTNDSMSYILDLRVASAGEYWLNSKTGITQYSGGNKVETMVMSPMSLTMKNQDNTKNGLPIIPDDEKTLEAWSKITTADEAKALLLSAYQQSNGKDNSHHQMALQAVTESRRRMLVSC